MRPDPGSVQLSLVVCLRRSRSKPGRWVGSGSGVLRVGLSLVEPEHPPHLQRGRSLIRYRCSDERRSVDEASVQEQNQNKTQEVLRGQRVSTCPGNPALVRSRCSWVLVLVLIKTRHLTIQAENKNHRPAPKRTRTTTGTSSDRTRFWSRTRDNVD